MLLWSILSFVLRFILFELKDFQGFSSVLVLTSVFPSAYELSLFIFLLCGSWLREYPFLCLVCPSLIYMSCHQYLSVFNAFCLPGHVSLVFLGSTWFPNLRSKLICLPSYSSCLCFPLPIIFCFILLSPQSVMFPCMFSAGPCIELLSLSQFCFLCLFI